MALANLALSDTPLAAEVWDMFWELTSYLNGNVSFDDDTDFGTSRDFSVSSKNIKSHKVKWNSNYGHDHGQGGADYRLKPGCFRKRNVDLNSARTLWADLDTEGSPTEKLVVVSFGVTVTVAATNIFGSAYLPYRPTVNTGSYPDTDIVDVDVDD